MVQGQTRNPSQTQVVRNHGQQLKKTAPYLERVSECERNTHWGISRSLNDLCVSSLHFFLLKLSDISEKSNYAELSFVYGLVNQILHVEKATKGTDFYTSFSIMDESCDSTKATVFRARRGDLPKLRLGDVICLRNCKVMWHLFSYCLMSCFVMFTMHKLLLFFTSQ